MGERAFTVAFAISLGVHLSLLVVQIYRLGWLGPRSQRMPIDVVYEHQAAEDELQELRERLAKAKRDALSAPTPSESGLRPSVRIPDRPLISAVESVTALLPGRAPVVDLTNLVDAARGDPVLMSYFGAIRDDIERSADQRAWFSADVSEGMVFVSFIVVPDGAIRAIDVVGERSVASPRLRDIAMQIVKAAAPFPPFPPSLKEPEQAVLIPLEFLLNP